MMKGIDLDVNMDDIKVAHRCVCLHYGSFLLIRYEYLCFLSICSRCL